MKRGEIAHSVTRGAFYLTLEKAAALVSGVAYFALLLRWLGPTKYGIMTLALSFAGLATMFTGNFEAFLERYAAEYQAQDRLLTLRRAHLHAMAIKLVLGAVVSVSLVAGAGFIALHFNTPELAQLLPLLAMMVALEGVSTTGRATLYGLQEFRWLCGITIVFHIVKTVMVGLLWWFKQGLVGLAIGLSVLTILQGLASTLVPLWMLRNARDTESSEPTLGGRELQRSIVAYCVPLLGARITFLSGQNLGKIVLGKLFAPTQLGFFSFAYQTVERFVELVYALSSSLLPSLTQLVARRERDRMRFVFDQSLRVIQVVALGLSCALVVFAHEITLLVGSRLFEPAVPLLRIMALVPIARTAQQPLTMLFQAMRRPGTVLALAILKFVAEFACYFALVPAFGMAGAGWANLVGAVASYVAAMWSLNRLLPEEARERRRVTMLGLIAFVPLLAIGTFLDGRLPHAWSLAARIALVPLAVIATFALKLVREEDLERLASFELSAPWMRRTRDGVVGVVRRLARAAAPGRAA